MKKLYNRYKLQFTDYLDSIELMAVVIIVVAFAIKGPIDLFTKGHYQLLNYIGLSIKSMIGVAIFFFITFIIDCINANHKSKK